MPALAQLLHRWAEQKGQFVWSHAGVLLQLLQQHTVPGQGDVSPQWWLLRMAVLRFVHRMDDYEQVVSIYAATKGFMDDVPVDAVRAFETAYLEFLKASKADLLNEIKDKKALDASIEERLQAAITEFKKDFKA